MSNSIWNVTEIQLISHLHFLEDAAAVEIAKKK